MYKRIKLERLVNPCHNNWFSRGILVDGGMRYGRGHYADGVGVYADASEPWGLFSPGDGYALLELRMHGNITKVKQGPNGRYVLKSDQTPASIGADCADCEVIAVLVLEESAPPFVRII